jgi:hypothetical protein
MTLPSDISRFLAPLVALQYLIDHFDHQGMIIGGIAASLLGRPRLTADLDAVILLSLERIPELIEQAAKMGMEPRIPNLADFARKSRVVLFRHRETGIDVDISLGILPFETEAVERSQVYKAENIEIRLPTPEDLIILKGVAHRLRDIQDIEAICAAHPNLDWKRIELWLQEFAAVLERPEIWRDIVAIKNRKV